MTGIYLSKSRDDGLRRLRQSLEQPLRMGARKLLKAENSLRFLRSTGFRLIGKRPGSVRLTGVADQAPILLYLTSRILRTGEFRRGATFAL